MFGADNKDSLGLAECEAPEGFLQGCPGNLITGCEGLQCRHNRCPHSPLPRVSHSALRS